MHILSVTVNPSSESAVESGERWLVHADTLYEAACELAVKVGIGLAD